MLREAQLLREAGARLTVISGGRSDEIKALLPAGCEWRVAQPGRSFVTRLFAVGEYLMKALHVEADVYHAHTSLGLMLVAWLAARLRGRRSFGDFNDIVLLLGNEKVIDQSHVSPHYESAAVWCGPKNESERSRLDAFADILPDDVASVLDVAGGDGRLMTVIKDRVHDVVVMDRSSDVLQLVPSGVRTVTGEPTLLPFDDDSRDAVVTATLLQRLTDEELERAKIELQRVAKRYIVVGVPFEEQLDVRDARCPIDGTVFSSIGHIRRFDLAELEGLFDSFEPVRHIQCGMPRQTSYHPLLLKIRRRLGGLWARPQHSICPHCGRDVGETGVKEHNAVGRLCNNLNARVLRRTRIPQSYIFVLYRRSKAATKC